MRILYLSPIPFDGLRQRPQFLAEGLAREHEVIYLDPTVSMMKFLIKGGERPKGFVHQAGERLTVRRLNGSFSAHRSLEGLWSGFGAPERMQLKSLLQTVDAVWIGFAPWFDLVRDFSGKIIYDRMDDNALLTENPLLRRLILRIEPALMQRADVLFVSARRFYEEAVTMGLHPILLPNAVEKWQAEQVWVPALPHQLGVRIFGYVGMLAHWFDFDAIRAVLDAAPENRVILVGPEEIARMDDPRVTYMGVVPKEQVGAWIASFDVCLYPFQSSPLLDTINPVKIYEYLAQNKPVLAAYSREIEAFGQLVHSYTSLEQLQTFAAQPLFAPFATEADRRAFIAPNEWDARISVIFGKLEAV